LIAELKTENAFALKCDVTDPKSVSDSFKGIESKFGVVNILINNGGVCKNVNILDEGEEAFRKMNEVIDTNVRGLVQCTREAFRLMKKSDDYAMIININSIAGHSVPFMTFPMNLYAPSKFAVTAIIEVIQQELVIAENTNSFAEFVAGSR
jgi:NADP+-dependent farnesol dehydrogenase